MPPQRQRRNAPGTYDRHVACRKVKMTGRPGDGCGCGTKTSALSTMHFIADRLLLESSLTCPAGNAGATFLLYAPGGFRRCGSGNGGSAAVEVRDPPRSFLEPHDPHNQNYFRSDSRIVA